MRNISCLGIVDQKWDGITDFWVREKLECAQSWRERTRKEGMRIKEGNSNKRTEKILLEGRTTRRITLCVRDRLTTALFLSIAQGPQCLNFGLSSYLQPWPCAICIGTQSSTKTMAIRSSTQGREYLKHKVDTCLLRNAWGGSLWAKLSICNPQVSGQAKLYSGQARLSQPQLMEKSWEMFPSKSKSTFLKSEVTPKWPRREGI